jgi:hypothetical protein
MPYKATYNYKCLNQTYEIGQEYKIEGKPILCERGFHFCNIAKDTLSYYWIKPNFKLLEIEDLNPDETDFDFEKSCSNHIKILREINDPDELMQLLELSFTCDDENLKVVFSDGFSYEYTYDKFGNELTFKNSTCYCVKYIRDESGKFLNFDESK